MIKVAFCTKDIELQINLFTNCEVQGIELTNLRSTKSLLEHVKSNVFDVVILDEDIYKIENINNVQSNSIKDILKYLNSFRKETVFVFVARSAKGFKNLKRTFENIYYFNKNEFEDYRFFKFISCCEKFNSSSIIVGEIPLKEKISTSLYFSGNSQRSEKIFLKKDTLITSSFISTLKKKNINHLYIRNEDLGVFYKSHKMDLSRKMHQLWDDARLILLKTLDDSGKFSVKHGNHLIKLSNELCNEIFSLIIEVKDLTRSFNLLVLPRFNEVNFAVNNIILSAIFTQILNKKFDNDLALAAFSYFHYINSDQTVSRELLFKLKSEDKLIKFQKHFREKGILRTTKAMKYYNLAYENLNGTGIPNGEVLNIKEPEYEIIKLCKLIQELRLVHNGELERPFKDILPNIKKFESNLNPKLLKIIDGLVKV